MCPTPASGRAGRAADATAGARVAAASVEWAHEPPPPLLSIHSMQPVRPPHSRTTGRLMGWTGRRREEAPQRACVAAWGAARCGGRGGWRNGWQRLPMRECALSLLMVVCSSVSAVRWWWSEVKDEIWLTAAVRDPSAAAATQRTPHQRTAGLHPIPHTATSLLTELT